MGKHYSISPRHFDALTLASQDINNIALVAEGGGQRGIFTAGVLDAFLAEEFNPFSLLIGASAGSLNLASYICGHKGHSYKIITQATRSPHFFDLQSWLMGKQGMNLDWLIEQTEGAIPLDWQHGNELMKTKQVLAVASNAQNYQSQFFDLSTTDWREALKATSAIPTLSGNPVIIDQQRWVDGGLTSAIPVEEAYRRGYKHIVVIRTVPIQTQFKHDWLNNVKKLTSHKNVNELATMMLTHEENYRQTQRFLSNPPEDVTIYEVHPNKDLNSKLLGSSKQALQADYNLGIKMGKLFMSTIAKKLNLYCYKPMSPSIHTTEDNLFTHLNYEQKKILDNSIRSTFCGMERVNIHWFNYNPNQREEILVIVQGRNETYHKYLETIGELSQHFNIYTYDHRGQGESDRLTDDKELGHVTDFNNYVTDLHMFMDNIVTKDSYYQASKTKTCYILAHSMGGAITTQYLSHYPNKVTACTLSAPMFGILAPKNTKTLAHGAIHILDWFAKAPRFALGQHKYEPLSFNKNRLTHSQLRYKVFRHLYLSHPHLRLGGASTQWLNQAIKAGQNCLKNGHKLSTPTLILQAGDDAVVDNKQQVLFDSRCPASKLEVIPNAWHDLFIESDVYRKQAITKMLCFFKCDLDLLQ